MEKAKSPHSEGSKSSASGKKETRPTSGGSEASTKRPQSGGSEESASRKTPLLVEWTSKFLKSYQELEKDQQRKSTFNNLQEVLICLQSGDYTKLVSKKIIDTKEVHLPPKYELWQCRIDGDYRLRYLKNGLIILMCATRHSDH